VRLKRYDEALPLLERGAGLFKEDPGVHYQLFLVYSRLKRKADADRELATFKTLEEARKAADAGAPVRTQGELPPPPDDASSPKGAAPAQRPPSP
jgi:hypothetical protein